MAFLPIAARRNRRADRTKEITDDRCALAQAAEADARAADIAPAMKAVTSALAAGAIRPGEAATIAAVVDTFVRAIETSDFKRRLKIVEEEQAAQPARVPGMFGTGLGGQFNL